VHQVRMVYYGGEHTRDLAFETVVPQNQIETFRIDGNGLYFEVAGTSDDPYLLFSTMPEAPEQPSRVWVLLKGVVFSLLAAALFSGIFRLLSWYFNS
jgi:hypothetical protein